MGVGKGRKDLIILIKTVFRRILNINRFYLKYLKI